MKTQVLSYGGGYANSWHDCAGPNWSLAIQHGAQAVDSFEMLRRCFQKAVHA